MTQKMKSKAATIKQEWITRRDLACAFRLIAHWGWDDLIWNHISARIPGHREGFLINPFGLRYDEITASSLIKIDSQEQSQTAKKKVNLTGFIIHSAFYQQRPEIACVLHTHAPYGLAVSALEKGLMPFVQDGFLFHEQVGYHSYEGLSTKVSERRRMAKSLGKRNQLILRNHGLLTVGTSVGEAVVRMYYLEKACKTQILVQSSGQAIRLPKKKIRRRAASQYRDFYPGSHEWPALYRLAVKLDPSFQD